MFVTDRKHFVETLLQQRVLVDVGSIFTIDNTLRQEVLEELVEPAGVVLYDLVYCVVSKSDKTWDDLGRIGGLCNLESQQAMSYMTLHLLRSAWYFIAIVALDYNLEDPMPM